MPQLRTSLGHILTLPPRRVSVGESAANEIAIAPGHDVAAVHFHLQPWESGHFMEDAASGLGTLVNGCPLAWAPLKHGDFITAGRLQFLYEHESGGPLPDFPGPGPGIVEVSSELVARDVSPLPPSWLPPEALQPPLSPVEQAALRQPATAHRKKRAPFVVIVCLLLAAATAAVWWMKR